MSNSTKNNPPLLPRHFGLYPVTITPNLTSEQLAKWTSIRAQIAMREHAPDMLPVISSKMTPNNIIKLYEGLFCCMQVTRGQFDATAWITDCLDVLEGNDKLVVGLALECKTGMLAFLQRLGSTFNPGTALVAKYHVEFKSLAVEDESEGELALTLGSLSLQPRCDPQPSTSNLAEVRPISSSHITNPTRTGLRSATALVSTSNQESPRLPEATSDDEVPFHPGLPICRNNATSLEARKRSSDRCALTGAPLSVSQVAHIIPHCVCGTSNAYESNAFWSLLRVFASVDTAEKIWAYVGEHQIERVENKLLMQASIHTGFGKECNIILEPLPTYQQKEWPRVLYVRYIQVDDEFDSMREIDAEEEDEEEEWLEEDGNEGEDAWEPGEGQLQTQDQLMHVLNYFPRLSIDPKTNSVHPRITSRRLHPSSLKKHRHIIDHNEILAIATTDPANLPLPNPDIMRIYAAIARLKKMTGMAGPQEWPSYQHDEPCSPWGGLTVLGESSEGGTRESQFSVDPDITKQALLRLDEKLKGLKLIQDIGWDLYREKPGGQCDGDDGQPGVEERSYEPMNVVLRREMGMERLW